MTQKVTIGYILKRLIALWSFFPSYRKRHFFILVLMMVLSAFAEVLTIGAVVPFLTALTMPEKFLSYPIVSRLIHFFGLSNTSDLIFPLCICFSSLAVVSGLFRISLLWVSTRITCLTGSELSQKVFSSSLNKLYINHKKTNSSDVINKVTNSVNTVIFGVIQPTLIFVSSSILMFIIFGALLAISPYATFISLCFFGGAYFLITLIVKTKLYTNSKVIVREQGRAIKVLQESIGGIRDIILDSTHQIYIDLYSNADLNLRKAQGTNNFIGIFPRYLMEMLGIVLISILAYTLIAGYGSVLLALPILGAFGIGAQKILPSLQQIFSSWGSVIGSLNQLEEILDLLRNSVINKSFESNQKLSFSKSITFKSVGFKYSQHSRWILKNLSFDLPKGVCVGVIGKTGEGKSTLIDLLMGLLSPSEGEVFVDDQLLIGANVTKWQKMIAHVPQEIFLADLSLEENIAFGVPKAEIDATRLRHAASCARILEYIDSLPNGFKTVAGERGVSLSGGQRQRIGIARAIYKNVNVLVLDEATSALDSETEKEVIDSILNFNNEMTLLMVAHRHSTLSKCDLVIELSEGSIVRKDTYENIFHS